MLPGVDRIDLGGELVELVRHSAALRRQGHSKERPRSTQDQDI
jgi:hypothetical protein